MGWVVITSRAVSRMHRGGVDSTYPYATFGIGRSTVGTETRYFAFLTGTWAKNDRRTDETSASTRESGVDYRARLVATYDGSNINSTVTIKSSENPSGGKNSNVPGTNSGSGTIEGTLYLEKYIPEPPSRPSSISVPSSIKEGESFTVSWGSGSGATRYHLERSVNGGSYTQIYSGSSRSYSDTALASWDTVIYRVRSYNSDGYSSYRTSTTRTIQHFPEFQMRINGSLKTSDNGWVKVNGVLKEIDSIWVKVSGTLKEV